MKPYCSCPRSSWFKAFKGPSEGGFCARSEVSGGHAGFLATPYSD